VGLSTAPLIFGRLMDRGMPGAVLVGVAVFQGLAVLVALRVGDARVASGPTPAVPPAA
jgi:MFS transporter, FSR family, fosmidomycin resistance protein